MPTLAKRQLAAARGRSIKARSLDDPDTLSGASFLDIDALAVRRGWRVAPTRKGDGRRWQAPGTRGADQVRYHGGNPADPNPIKRGPYARLTRGGVRYPQPIPLAGNPTLK